jgi:hypothetical protein
MRPFKLSKSLLRVVFALAVVAALVCLVALCARSEYNLQFNALSSSLGTSSGVAPRTSQEIMQKHLDIGPEFIASEPHAVEKQSRKYRTHRRHHTPEATFDSSSGAPSDADGDALVSQLNPYVEDSVPMQVSKRRFPRMSKEEDYLPAGYFEKPDKPGEYMQQLKMCESAKMLPVGHVWLNCNRDPTCVECIGNTFMQEAAKMQGACFNDTTRNARESVIRGSVRIPRPIVLYQSPAHLFRPSRVV